MKYDKILTEVKDAMIALNISSEDSLTRKSVRIVSEYVHKERIEHLKNTNTQRNFHKRRKFYDQMIARDLLKLFHLENKSKGLKAGYVYLITNPAFPEWVKVGTAIDVNDRLNSYQTSSPFRDYEMNFYFFSFDRLADESKIISMFESKGEWVKSDINTLKQVCKDLSPFR